jgi:hypothetical protein
MAVVRVEIAFNAGQRTAASLRTWTDVTDYVELAEGITITWGRQDERSTADANQLTLTLDNSDGRFTFGKTSGPYGSGVKLDRAIRVILDPVDGSEAVYFDGFVNEWPTEWNGTDAYAKATITASSRLSRLGMIAALKSLIETEYLADSPAAYYTLGEAEGATQANDTSGNSADPLTLAGDASLPVVFGSATGPATDGLTAAQFQGTLGAASEFNGQYLTSALYGDLTAYTLECFYLQDTAVNAMLISAPGSSAFLQIGTTSTGEVFGQHGATTVTSSPLSTGHTHHVALTWTGTTLTLYVDGVSAGSSAVSTAMPGPAVFSVGGGLSGVVAHVARYTTALSATRIAAHANAGLTGFAGETTSARLIRYAGYAGIPTAEISTETGQTTMVGIDTTGKQAVELMRICETTEGGVVYDGRDGTLTFHNRAHRYVVASSFTLNMAEQEVEADYLPKADRAGLANDVTVQNSANTVTAHRFDGPGPGTSQYEYGVATLPIETASEDDDAPAFQAGWNLYKYKDPKERVPSLTVDALAQVGKTPNCAAVLAATVGDKTTVSNRPSQAATSSVDYFIEGGTIQIGPELLRVTWNLSPSSPEADVLVIGDATRGVIGTNPVAF